MRLRSHHPQFAAGLRLVLSTAGIAGLLIGALIIWELVARREADVLTGPARIVDGDTIEIDDVNVRLAGLDAPERTQECRDARDEVYGCGRLATDYLTFLVADRPVTCRGNGRDRWGRMIGVCMVEGTNLSEAMIRRGWAVAFMGDLDGLERQAREAGVGMWRGPFDRPADWRRQRRSAAGILSFGALRDAARGLALRILGRVDLRAPYDE